MREGDVNSCAQSAELNREFPPHVLKTPRLGRFGKIEDIEDIGKILQLADKQAWAPGAALEAHRWCWTVWEGWEAAVAGMADQCHGRSKLLRLDGHHPADSRVAAADVQRWNIQGGFSASICR